MTTLQQAIDGRLGPWVAWVEIGGLGSAQGPYRFCTSAPAFAAGDPTWIAILRDIPKNLKADVDVDGGVERAGVLEFTLVDVDDFLTDLLRFDAEPVGELLQILDRTSTQFFVRNGAGFAVDQVLHLGAEAMVVTATAGPGTPGLLDVTRGALGTLAVDHPILTPIRGWVTQLDGREVSFYLAPYRADSIAERIDLGTFSIRKARYSEGFTGWRLSCGSQVLGLKRRIAKALQGHYLATHLFGARMMSLERVGTPRRLVSFNVWPGDLGRQYFELNEKELAIGIGTGVSTGTDTIDQIVLEQRGVLGSRPIDVIKVFNEDSVKVTRPLVADTTDGLGAFRYIPPTAADQEDRADLAVVQSDHFVDIMACLMVSSRRAADELELTNYVPGENNYSTLPIGFGAAIRAERIDWPAMAELKARTPNWRFPAFVLREPGSLAEVVTKHFLKPLGVFLVLHNGKIRPVLPRLPFEGQTATTIDESNLLAPARPLSPALLSGGYDGAHTKKAVLLKPRDPTGDEVKILITAGDLGPHLGDDDEPGPEDVLELDLPGVRTNQGGVTAFFEELAIRRLYRRARPSPEFGARVDLALRDLELGGLAGLDFSGAPNPKTGQRGLSTILTVVGKALNLDLEAPGFELALLGYGGGARVGRISPAAVVQGFAAGTVTLAANRYTSPDGAILDLPATEAEQFKAGMVVKLIDQAGLDAHVTTQIVQADGAAGAVQLDGDFGTPPAGLIMVLADYAEARTEEQDRYVAFADAGTRQIGGSTRSPWQHGEN